MRTAGVTEAAVDRAFDDGAILRTHVLRPTWHFLTPDDIRWMLTLSAPRVHAANAPYYRRFELTASVLRRSRTVLERALRGGRTLTRTELAHHLDRAGIRAEGPRLAYLMMHAELEAVVRSGPRRGKQFTYALLDERAPRARRRSGDEALAELTTRYFSSHGPATARDFAWWSGLTMRDVKTGLALVDRILEAHAVAGRDWWSPAGPRRGPRRRESTSTAWLLPNYDEFLIAYKDRDLVTGSPKGVVERDPFPYHLVVDGALAGSWRRTTRAAAVLIGVAPYRRLSDVEMRRVEAAALSYGRFAGAAVSLTMLAPRAGAL